MIKDAIEGGINQLENDQKELIKEREENIQKLEELKQRR